MKIKKHTMTVIPRHAGLLLMLAFLTIGQILFAQTKKVTGVVKDATGETVIGASVIEKELQTEPLLMQTVIFH